MSAEHLRQRLLLANRTILQPQSRLSLSEWAAQNYYLPLGSPQPGRFRFYGYEYQRGVFDAISDPHIRRVVIIGAVQMLKSESIRAYLAYIISNDPAPAMMVLPDETSVSSFSKEKLDTMLETVPCLRGKVKEKRLRDSGNTTKQKSFAGGYIALATANSPSQLASRSIRYLFLDEIDKYKTTKEGNPLELARGRLTMYPYNSKEVVTSSPTLAEASLIEAEYQLSDKRIFMVPCHECEAEQQLVWRQVKGIKDDDKRTPKNAYYECEHCLAHWTDGQRLRNINKGRWVATNPQSDIAGFHISHLYSSVKTLRMLAEKFFDLKDKGEFQEWANLHLAEVWHPPKMEVSGITWATRQEDYTPNKLLEGVLLITAGVDMQAEYLAVEVVGWGIADESWSIEYLIIHGDPTTPQPWAQLTDVLAKYYYREDGVKMRIAATCVDSQGQDGWAENATKYCAKYSNVYAIKGQAGDKPIFTHQSKNYHFGGKYVPVGVDRAKHLTYHRLTEFEKPGPNYCHFPSTYPEDYFDGLTAEERRIKQTKGVKTYVWVKKKGKQFERNEPLDCRVYATAARASLVHLDMAKRAEQLKAKAGTAKAPKEELQQPLAYVQKHVAKAHRPNPHRPRRERPHRPW